MLRLEKFSGPGSTPARRRFWDNALDAITSCRKLPGKNISVTEYDSGSLIDVNPQREHRAASNCPEGITVQFSEVGFGCGCSLFFEGSEGSFLITDDGDTNSFVTNMGLSFFVTPGCGDCGTEDQRLLWFSSSGSGLSPHVLVSFWNDENDCSGGPSGTNFAEYFGLIMVLLSGTYYLMAYFLNSLVFYGSTTDLSLPIANTLSCDSSFHDYSDDPAIDCMLTGVTVVRNFNSVGQGGTASVVIA